MKFLEDAALLELSHLLQEVVIGDRIITCTIDPFSLKRAGSDKKTAALLEKRYDEECALHAEVSPFLPALKQPKRKRSGEQGDWPDEAPVNPEGPAAPLMTPFGDLNQKGSNSARQTLTDLILTLNAVFPDHDFLNLKHTSFKKVPTVREVVDLVGNRIGSVRYAGSLPAVLDPVGVPPPPNPPRSRSGSMSLPAKADAAEPLRKRGPSFDLSESASSAVATAATAIGEESFLAELLGFRSRSNSFSGAVQPASSRSNSISVVTVGGGGAAPIPQVGPSFSLGAALLPFSSSSILPPLFTQISRLVSLSDCEVYSYIPPISGDPFSPEDGVLWTENFFLLNRKKSVKKLIFLTMTCQRAEGRARASNRPLHPHGRSLTPPPRTGRRRSLSPGGGRAGTPTQGPDTPEGHNYVHRTLASPGEAAAAAAARRRRERSRGGGGGNNDDDEYGPEDDEYGHDDYSDEEDYDDDDEYDDDEEEEEEEEGDSDEADDEEAFDRSRYDRASPTGSHDNSSVASRDGRWGHDDNDDE